MIKKFIIFNVIVFLVFLVLFRTGTLMDNVVDYDFAGYSFSNPVNGKNYHFTGIILQVFSVIGVLIQLVFVNKKLSND